MNQKRMRQLRCKLMSLCMVLLMAFAFIPTGIVHAETESIEAKIYEVKINVAPKEAEVTFYKGSDAVTPLEEGQVKDNGTVENYHQYILRVPEGRYSYRSVEGDTELGGMTFDVPFEEEILFDPESGGGVASGRGLELTFRRVNYYSNDTKIKNIGDYTVHAIPAGMPEVKCGPQYKDEQNRVVTPVMVVARGNALVYTVNFDINDKELREQYAIAQNPNDTFSEKFTTDSRILTLNKTVVHTIKAPKGAKVQMFEQRNNFNVVEIPVKYVDDNRDGTLSYKFTTSGGANLTYRVTMDGKITRAGYLGLDPETVVVTYDECEDPLTEENKANVENIDARLEASTLVNVNGQNNLKLGEGETFRLRAYRAAWQIINSDTQNIMIEPDFNYQIISGEEHIVMTPVTGQCTGNAGTGEKANWWDIKGISKGTAVIEISYDAILIGGEGTTQDALHGATNPQRRSLIVIQVGEQDNTLKMYPEGRDVVWDTEFDTVYFIEDTGSLAFNANLGNDVPDKVEISTDNGFTWRDVTSINDKYIAEGLVPGNNILKFTKGDRVEYQVVRGAKVTYTLTNKSHDIENLYMVGDVVELKFDGLFIPISKISGIYNPGYSGGGHKLVYGPVDGVTQSPRGEQYTFVTRHEITLTLEKAGEVVLDSGYIDFEVMGNSDPLGGHRMLTDSGCGVNFSAVPTKHQRSILPTIKFDVSEAKEVDVTVDINAENPEITITDSQGKVMSVENGKYALKYGEYDYVIIAKGYERTEGSFLVLPEDGSEKTVSVKMIKLNDVVWDGVSEEEAPVENGVYQISKAAHLAWFAKQVNSGNGVAWDAELLNDLSLGEKNLWTPMLKYSGTFDGNGHSITDLYVLSNAGMKQGLFGSTASGAVIKNLEVDGSVTDTGRNGSAGFYGAGIVGDVGAGTRIENCINRTDVSGYNYAGGIAGRVSVKAEIVNCYNTGDITGSYAGGITGKVSATSGTTRKMIKNCYNTGYVEVIGNTVGGAICYENEADGEVFSKNCYYLENSCNQTDMQAGTKVTSDELKALAPTLGDAYLTGVEEYNNGYPVLTLEGERILPYVAEDAITDIESYKNPADYRDAQKTELTAAIETAKTAISSAKTVADVNQAAADAKAVMDLIKTDAQLKAEEANKPADTPTQTPTDKPEEQPTEKPVETPTVPTELTAPANVKAANVAKSGKVKVTWKKVEGAAKYQVYRATKKNGKYTLVKTVATTSYTDSSATVGKSFYFKVKAVSADKNVKASAFSKAVKGTVVLKAPVVTAKSKTKKQVKLTWKKVSGAKKYEVYRAASKNGKYKKIATTTKLSYTNKKLKSGKTYYYKVKAIGKKKAYNSAFSTVKKCKVK